MAYPLSTCLNLLATRGQSFSAHPVERLTTPARLGDWLDRCELIPVRPPGPADLDAARALREALRAVALATVSHELPPEAAVDTVVEFLSAEPDLPRLLMQERRLRTAQADTGAALARIARQAVDYLTGPDRHTLTICAEQDCRWVFGDPTGRRRWCPAPACASRGRVRAMRARRTNVME